LKIAVDRRCELQAFGKLKPVPFQPKIFTLYFKVRGQRSFEAREGGPFLAEDDLVT
jgi:hypothetical protein